MKFFHLSDLHLGARMQNYSLHDDQVHILDQIVIAAGEEQPDAVLIAGDVYDKADPGPDAVAIFNDFIVKLKSTLPDVAVMIIGGNHDNGERINLYRDILKLSDVYVAGRVPDIENGPDKVTLQDEEGTVDFYLLPFVRPGFLRRPTSGASLSYEDAVRLLLEKADPDPDIRSVLVSHQFFVPSGSSADEVERMDSEMPRIGNVDAISADVLAPFDYAALGHIHKPTRVTDKAFYCGTPLPYSLSERNQQKSVRVVELPYGKPPQFRLVPLRPRRAVRRLEGSLSDVISQPSEDYIEVILSGERNTDRSTLISRLRQAFPNLLSYSFAEQMAAPGQEACIVQRRELDPLELCLEFLGSDADEETEQLLKEIIGGLEETA